MCLSSPLCLSDCDHSDLTSQSPSQTTRAMWGGSNVGATSVGMGAFIKSVNEQRRSSVNDSGGKGKAKGASHASPDIMGKYLCNHAYLSSVCYHDGGIDF